MIKVNILLGRFQPFTKGHLKMVETGYEKNGLKTVLLLIVNKKFDEKHPFFNESIINLINKFNNPLIHDILIVKNADIGIFGQLLHDNNYEPVYWLCGTDRFEKYDLMCKKYKDQFKLPYIQALEIYRTDEDISATQVREALINNNLDLFTKLCIGDKNIFDELKRELHENIQTRNEY